MDINEQTGYCNMDWLVGRSHWLQCKEIGMFCLLCQMYDKRPFNHTWNKVPCSRLRLQSVTAHERSAAHMDIVRMEAAALGSKNVVQAINPALPARGMEQAFCCLYFLTKQRIAHTTNYGPLLDLVGLLGVDVKAKISVARNATYTSDKTIQEMVLCQRFFWKK